MPTGFEVIKYKFPSATTTRRKRLFNCFYGKYHGQWQEILAIYRATLLSRKDIAKQFSPNLRVPSCNIAGGGHHTSELAA